jgi:hypothetical protein
MQQSPAIHAQNRTPDVGQKHLNLTTEAVGRRFQRRASRNHFQDIILQLKHDWQ